MFEVLAGIASAWREILHVSEWTGLSVGALVVLALLFVYAPPVRSFVAFAAIAVVAAYIGCVFGESRGLADGRAEVQVKWDAARRKAAAAAVARDASIENSLEAKYAPERERLQAQLKDSKERADTNETRLKDLERHGAGRAAPRAACELGAAADRVPARRQAR
jgi:hypothetical protein